MTENKLTKNKKIWLHLLIVALPVVVVLAIIFVVVIRGNTSGANEDHVPAFVETPTEEPTDEPTEAAPTEEAPPYDPYQSARWDYPPEEPTDPRPRSFLTGMPIDEADLMRRPIAVVINNLFQALPQSGISSADIVYEVLAEGDVTRLVGIFQSDIPEKIGPVRSARDSFIDFAFNHDAIFVHHGRSPDANTRLNATRITNLDGMSLEGTVFWRDRTYPAWHHNSGTRPLEHSSYTSRQRIETHMASRSIRDTVGEDPAYGFVFGAVPSVGAGAANTVTVPFSVPYARTFIFDPDTGLYFVENRDGPLKDAENQTQVTVRNILVQQTTMRVTGDLGQRTIGTVGSGDGYLITGGMYQRVSWAKDSHTSPMRWYFEDGSPLVLAPGPTWICVFQITGTVVFEG